MKGRLMDKVSNEKEPFDMRLLLLRLWRQTWLIAGITLAGIILFGGGYYLKYVILPGPAYRAQSLYQIEYALDPVTGNQYTYINGTTWNKWMDTKEFLDLLYAHLEGMPEEKIERETMKQYLSADLQMDLRMPDTKVTTPDPDLSLRLAAAVEKSMEDFAATQKGIDNIRLVDPAIKANRYTEARPLHACVLAAVVTCFLTVVFLAIRELGDDSIRLPIAASKRFGIKTLGTIHGQDFAANIGHVLEEADKADNAAVLFWDTQEFETETLEALKKAVPDRKTIRWIPLGEEITEAEQAEKLKSLDVLILAVRYGKGTGSRMEWILNYLKVQDRLPDAFLLCGADEWLLRRYYHLPARKLRRK